MSFTIHDACRAAIDAWRKAFRTGDFADLVALAADDIEYRFCLPPHNVLRQGKARFLEAVEFLRGLNIRVEQTPLTPALFNDDTTAFEFEAAGHVNGSPVRAVFLVLITVADGRIVALREYTPPQA